MKFIGFSIHATPFIHGAMCKCGTDLKEVSNGFISTAMFCPKCENVYLLKLIKQPTEKISKRFLEQCREEIKQCSNS